MHSSSSFLCQLAKASARSALCSVGLFHPHPQPHPREDTVSRAV